MSKVVLPNGTTRQYKRKETTTEYLLSINPFINLKRFLFWNIWWWIIGGFNAPWHYF